DTSAGRDRTSDSERVLDLVETADQPLHVLRQRVEVEARARRRRNTETGHQRLCAVVAGADGNALPVEDLRDVVRVHVLELEADDARSAVCGWPEDADARDLGERVHRLHDQLALVRLD